VSCIKPGDLVVFDYDSCTSNKGLFMQHKGKVFIVAEFVNPELVILFPDAATKYGTVRPLHHTRFRLYKNK
jgi:hypothetical protein